MRASTALAALGAATFLAAGCGGDEETESVATPAPTAATPPPSTNAQTSTRPAECATNASGQIVAIDKAAGRGTVKSRVLGRLTFDLEDDVLSGRPVKGALVYYTYKKSAKKGEQVRCLQVRDS